MNGHNSLDELIALERKKMRQIKDDEGTEKDKEIERLKKLIGAEREDFFQSLNAKNLQFEQLSAICRKLQSENNQLKSEQDEAHLKITNLESETQKLAGEIARLRSGETNEAQRQTINRLRGEIRDLETSMAHETNSLTSKIYDLKHELKTKESRYESRLGTLHRVDWKFQMMQRKWYWRWLLPK